MNCLIVVWIVVQVLLVSAGWVAIMLALRAWNFAPSGGRNDVPRDGTAEITAKQIEYHNNAAYRIFEFFLKIALALLGGVAYLSQAPTSANSVLLVRAGAWLLLLSAAVFSLGIVVHQKSKIERWPRRYNWYQPLTWFELWLIQGMLLVAVGFMVWFVPRLANAG